eukprot:21746-Eustigmatos_ZCMA.PRE.1
MYGVVRYGRDVPSSNVFVCAASCSASKPPESATGAGVIPKVAVKTGDPGVLGLACFCLPGILLQLHNLQ